MTARLLAPTPENIACAANALQRGELVGMPTETVYGLAGLALDETALARIFAAKDRPTFDPLISHVAAPEGSLRPGEFDWLEYLASLLLVDTLAMGPLARRRACVLAELWPGPLTLVLPKQPRVPDLATAGLSTVAVRSPRHPVAQALLREVAQPLAAPSANRFGRISPTRAGDVLAELGDRIELILDGGPCELGLESTVVQVCEEHVLLLRPGAYTRESLEEKLQERVAAPRSVDSSLAAAYLAPGMLPSHYAPSKPLFVCPTLHAQAAGREKSESTPSQAIGRRVGVLCYAESGSEGALPAAKRSGAASEIARLLGIAPAEIACVRALSKGDPNEAARNLFRTLRELDADPRVECIVAELPPNTAGLNHAIADRLQRASTAHRNESAY